MAASFGGFCPVELYFLDLKGMYDILNGYPEGSTGILVADKTLLELIRQADMPEKLAQRYDLIWVDHVTPNPTQRDILDSLKKIGSRDATWIVAVGGGSAIDQAKGISASYELFKGKVPPLRTSRP
jgi:alcohol dehydrogenase class IV